MTQPEKLRLLPRMTNSKVMNAIVFVVIACLPLLYAGLLSSAYQDPVVRVSNINAAVVNQDKQFTAELISGKTADYALGETLAEKLTNPQGQEVGFSWREMTLNEAQTALKSGDIRAYMVIPEDFSSVAGSLGTEDASQHAQAKLDIVTDDSVSYLAGTLSRTVAATLQSSLSSQVAEQYIDTMLVSLTTIGDGMSKAADGSSQLAEGTTTLYEGLGKLDTALVQAAQGSSELTSGAQSLATGSNTLSDGSVELSNGASALANGTGKINAAIPSVTDGAGQLSDGASKLNGGAKKVSTGASDLKSGVEKYTSGADQIAGGLNQLATQKDALVNGVKSLNDGATSLNDAVSGLPTSAQALVSGVDGVATGLEDLETGAQGVKSLLSALSSQCAAVTAAAGQAGQTFCATMTQAAGIQVSVADGASALKAGVGTSEDTAQDETLYGGLNSLSANAPKLAEGTKNLAAGATALKEKIGKSDDSASDKTIVGALNSLNAGAQGLTGNSESLRSGAAALSQGAGTLAEGSGSLSAGAKTLTSKLPTLSNSLSALNDGANSLASGASNLSEGAKAVADGAGQVADGTSALDQGIGQISDGAQSAVEGTKKLQDGSQDLSDSLSEGAEKIPTYDEADRETVSAKAAALAEVTAQRDNEVSNAAGGFSPMFLSLSLWIGAIAMFLVMPALDRRHSSREKWWISALRPMTIAMVLGVFQAIVSVVLLNSLIEINAKNVAGWIGIAILSSLAFVAVNQACIALLSYRGRFVSLLLLLLQITSMGGTFPVETAPKFFQWIHPYLPMTWTGYSFRAMIAGGGKTDAVSHTIVVLLSWMLVSLVIVYVSAKVRAGARPLAHDNSNTADTIDMTSAPFGGATLPVDGVDDENAIDGTVDALIGTQPTNV